MFIDQLHLEPLKQYAQKEYVPIIGEDAGQFLYDTVFALQPKNMLEIGTAIGYSAIVLVNASFSGHLTTIEKDPVRYHLAKQNFETYHVTKKVSPLLGDAFDVLTQLVNENAQFDFIFLDGPKGQYGRYYPLIKKCLSPKGILFCDNMNLHGLVHEKFIAHKQRSMVVNLRAFTEQIKTDHDVKTSFYNFGDGIAIVQKE